ncbi:MAG: hypothetical protein FWF10_07395 [Clostridiales bacterium]|nr:hypothetical protein [Clostridiales bacterium]
MEELSGLKIMLGDADKIIKDKEPPSFIWVIDSERLIYIITSVINFIKQKTPGHHYYYEDGCHLIVFSFLEYVTVLV